MDTPAALATRLADIRERLDHPPGVVLGVLRLPILDPLLGELEAAVRGEDGGARSSATLVEEIERTVAVLSRGMLGTSAEAVGRRARLVELLRRCRGGGLPAEACDPADAFGADLATMLSTDAELAAALGRLHPLLVRASSVAPTATWRAEAGALAAADGAVLAGATRRALAALLRAEIASRPDLLTGGLRLPNQRLVRGLLWYASLALERPAELLGAVGTRMGTSGRSDAVVRDTATANTCAALLGASTDPDAAAALASMRAQVTNRTVLKQVDRALEELAARAGVTVATLVELALPTFGLGAEGRVEIEAEGATAIIELLPGGDLRTRWRMPDGRILAAAPPELATQAPALVAAVDERRQAIEAAVGEERRRMDARLASERAWPEDAWRARFADHPVGRVFGRRLIWRLVGGEGAPDSRSALPQGDEWIGADGRALSRIGPGTLVRLWHPADASAEEVAAWRAALAAANVEQPIRQVDRETFQPEDRDRTLAADRRHGGRVVDHGRLRALLRQRGWAVPSLGAWDQGDEATAWRAFDDGLRAELRYQSVERVPTGVRVERARLVAVRFVRAAGPPTAAAADGRPVTLADVPVRVFSEAIRDVSLVVAVAESGVAADE